MLHRSLRNVTLENIKADLETMREGETAKVAGHAVTRRDVGVIEYEIAGHGPEAQDDAPGWLWRNRCA